MKETYFILFVLFMLQIDPLFLFKGWCHRSEKGFWHFVILVKKFAKIFFILNFDQDRKS